MKENCEKEWEGRRSGGRWGCWWCGRWLGVKESVNWNLTGHVSCLVSHLASVTMCGEYGCMCDGHRYVCVNVCKRITCHRITYVAKGISKILWNVNFISAPFFPPSQVTSHYFLLLMCNDFQLLRFPGFSWELATYSVEFQIFFLILTLPFAQFHPIFSYLYPLVPPSSIISFPSSSFHLAWNLICFCVSGVNGKEGKHTHTLGSNAFRLCSMEFCSSMNHKAVWDKSITVGLSDSATSTQMQWVWGAQEAEKWTVWNSSEIGPYYKWSTSRFHLWNCNYRRGLEKVSDMICGFQALSLQTHMLAMNILPDISLCSWVFRLLSLLPQGWC